MHIYIYIQYRYEASIQNILLFTVLLTECFPFYSFLFLLDACSEAAHLRGVDNIGEAHRWMLCQNMSYIICIYIHILWYIINNGFHWIKLLGSSLLQEIFWSQLCFAIWGYQCNQVREYITIHGLSRSMKDNGTKCTIVQTCQMLWCLTCYT